LPTRAIRTGNPLAARLAEGRLRELMHLEPRSCDKCRVDISLAFRLIARPCLIILCIQSKVFSQEPQRAAVAQVAVSYSSQHPCKTAV